VVVMALAINYAAYFIDIMPLATYGLIFYTIARFHHEMAESVFMGKTDYLESIAKKRSLDSVAVIAFRDEENEYLPGRSKMVALQKEFDAGNIFFCHNSFQDDQVLEGVNDICCMVVVAESGAQHEILERLQADLTSRGLESHVTQVFDFPDTIKRNRKLIPRFITMKTLCVLAQLPIDEG